MKKFWSLVLTVMISIAMIAPQFAMPLYTFADEEPAVTEATTEETTSEFTIDPYMTISMTDLYDQGLIYIQEDSSSEPAPLSETTLVEVSKTKYGNGLLIEGKVSTLKSIRIVIDHEFDFTNGEVGRIAFDGLKDKDYGMSVRANLYLNDTESTTEIQLEDIELRKQMGKKEWSNDGDRSVDLIGNELDSKYKVALGFDITGKKDSKNTAIALRSLEFCKTTVPVMYFHIDESEGSIDSMNSSEDHSAECYGTVDLKVPDAFNNDPNFKDEYASQESKTELALEYIRGRGNSTWYADKKPYKVKFDDAQNLFGFGKNKHWVLLANRYDNSMVRNRMTYWLGQQLGMEYTPQCVPVEVVMNGEYYGSYLLCEQIRVGTGRVEIDDLDDVKSDSPALTDDFIRSGGYLLSMEWFGEDDTDKGFTTEEDMNFFIESPDDNAPYFKETIVAFVNKAEKALFGKNFKNDSGESYADYIDLPAAVDYWWVQEFSENGDAYGSGSTYLYKKRNTKDTVDGIEKETSGKLYWGPLWDFDFVAWGDLEYNSEPGETLEYTGCSWMRRMLSDPVFANAAKDRWYEDGGLREKLVAITEEGGLLDRYLAQMETSYIYDHEKWGSFESDITEYSGEIEQLRSWIDKRIVNVDAAIKEGQLDTKECTVTFIIDGKTVAVDTYYSGQTLRNTPEVPEKEGYVFAGWDSGEYGYYYEDDIVMEDLTLTASYFSEDEITYPGNIYFGNYDVYLQTDFDGYENYYEFYNDYTVMPIGAFYDGIEWKSSDESIATVDEYGAVRPLAFGDVTITATLENGVSNSYKVHIIDWRETEFNEIEYVELDRKTLRLEEGGYEQLIATVGPAPNELTDMYWISTDENVASVDDLGVVSANSPGTAEIMLINPYTRIIAKCKVTVTEAKGATGTTFKYKGNKYRITADSLSHKTVKLIKGKNATTVAVPATVSYKGETYNVTAIGKKAFSKSKATRLIVKTKKLTKASVKNSLKGSKVSRITVKVGDYKANLKYAKKYRQIFKYKNSGKGVKVRIS